ncbi:hypothetical protein [Lentisalinibacter salinarum]|uniref:hypothetical protein n=1 Tax=Lentisalinibacter salinarum TaxID=2992239 RepID=UPI00386493B7
MESMSWIFVGVLVLSGVELIAVLTGRLQRQLRRDSVSCGLLFGLSLFVLIGLGDKVFPPESTKWAITGSVLLFNIGLSGWILGQKLLSSRKADGQQADAG